MNGILREVEYIADKYGFRAVIKTTEPGTANNDPAYVKMNSNPIPLDYYPVTDDGYSSTKPVKTKELPSYQDQGSYKQQHQSSPPSLYQTEDTQQMMIQKPEQFLPHSYDDNRHKTNDQTISLGPYERNNNYPIGAESNHIHQSNIIG